MPGALNYLKKTFMLEKRWYVGADLAYSKFKRHLGT